MRRETKGEDRMGKKKVWWREREEEKGQRTGQERRRRSWRNTEVRGRIEKDRGEDTTTEDRRGNKGW